MADQLAPGLAQEQDLRNGGFNDQEISEWKTKAVHDLQDGGFNDKEVQDYFGYKEPDMGPVKKLAQEAWHAPMALPEGKEPDFLDRVSSFMKTTKDSFIQGIEGSSSAMVVNALRNHSVTPEHLMPEDAGTFYRIASQVGTLAGDVPAMALGGAIGAFGGGLAGSEVPVVGTALGATLGAGAGANALPEAIRSTLMNYYEKGEIHNFQDFWERASSVFLDTAKSGAVGAATMGVGAKVGKVLGGTVAPTVAKTLATGASEVATMVTLGKAMEGQVPSAQDFLDGALVVGALHGAIGIAKTASPAVSAKMREIYSKTGVQPHEVIEEATKNPVVLQDLLAEGNKIPAQFDKAPAEPMTLSKELEAGKALAETPAGEAPPKTPNEIIREQIGEANKGQKTKYGWTQAYTDVVDRLHPLEKAVQELTDSEKLSASEDPYKQARMTTGSQGKLAHMAEKGMIDYEGNTTGKSMKAVFEPLGDKVGAWEEYAVSQRALLLEERQIKGLKPEALEAAKEVVATTETPEFKKTSQEFTDWQNGGLKYAWDAGLISEKEYNSMVEAGGMSFVSFKRIMEDGEVKGSGKSGKLKKEIKGSEKQIQNPIQTAMENMDLILRRAEKNRALRTFVELNEAAGEDSLIEKVATPMRPIEVQAKEVARSLKDQGIEDVNPTDLTVFRGQSGSLGKNEFEIWRDGKREVYRSDFPGLADAIKTLDGNAPATGLAFEIARGLTSIKKVGVTLTPDFILRNFFRDQFTAKAFGSAGFLDTLRAVGERVGKSDDYWNWMKSGGGKAGFLEVYDNYLKDNVFKLNDETGNFIDKAWNTIKTPFEYLKVAGEILEDATRLAEFKKVAGEKPTPASLMEGGFASREVTVDFQRMGAKTAAFNAITAFQNVAIQGLDRTVRAVKEDPVGTTTKAVTAITVPSILLWWANKDDPRVQEIPRWQRDLSWIIPTNHWQKVKDSGELIGRAPYDVRQDKDGNFEVNNGLIFRLPKPQELGLIFGTMVERSLDAFFTDNPRALDGFGETIKSLLLPSLIPDAGLPVLEHYANHNFFLDRPIVSQGNERLLPQYQYTDYTSETAKALGKLINVVPGVRGIGSDQAPLASPMVIDNYIHSWGGALGQYAVQLADKGIAPNAVKPSWTLADIPFIKAFIVRYPTASAQSIEDFRKRTAEAEKNWATIQSLGKQYKFADQAQLFQAGEFMGRMTGVKTALTTQTNFIKQVYSDPAMKPYEKRQQIDGAYYQMITVTRAANEGLDQLEKIIKDIQKTSKVSK